MINILSSARNYHNKLAHITINLYDIILYLQTNNSEGFSIKDLN